MEINEIFDFVHFKKHVMNPQGGSFSGTDVFDNGARNTWIITNFSWKEKDFDIEFTVSTPSAPYMRKISLKRIPTQEISEKLYLFIKGKVEMYTQKEGANIQGFEYLIKNISFIKFYIDQ